MSDWLPPILMQIADVIGKEGALALARVRGGSRVHFPTPERLPKDHWMVQTLGPDDAHKLCAAYAVDGTGATLDLPLGPVSPLNQMIHSKQRKIDKLLDEGLSADVIARQLGVHRTTVFRRKALLGDPKDDRQLDLF